MHVIFSGTGRSMKQVFLSDLKGILASRIMIAVAFVVLEGFVLAGIFMSNEALTSTAVLTYLFATVGILLYLVMEAGSIYLNNLRKVNYFDTMKAKGITEIKVLGYKIVHTLLAMVAYALLYFGALAIDVMLIGNAFPEEKSGLKELGFREMVVGSGDPFVPAFLTTLLELLSILLVLLVLAYFSVTMTYAFFVKLRFAGMCSVFVFFTFGFVVVKANTVIPGAMQGIALHLLCTGINLVVTAIFLTVTYLTLKTKILRATQEV